MFGSNFLCDTEPGNRVRKLIEFDEDTFAKLKQLARDRMATIQELADEAFTDLMKKHGIPIDLRDALKKSAASTDAPKKAASEGRTSAKAGKRK
jgi:non-homologous end joining protein Ku